MGGGGEGEEVCGGGAGVDGFRDVVEMGAFSGGGLPGWEVGCNVGEDEIDAVVRVGEAVGSGGRGLSLR